MVFKIWTVSYFHEIFSDVTDVYLCNKCLLIGMLMSAAENSWTLKNFIDTECINWSQANVSKLGAYRDLSSISKEVLGRTECKIHIHIVDSTKKSLSDCFEVLKAERANW